MASIFSPPRIKADTFQGANDGTSMSGPGAPNVLGLLNGGLMAIQTAAAWTADTGVPPNGVRCHESDTGLFKYGDGTNLYSALEYFEGTGGGGGGTSDTLYDANTILAATVDNTPTPRTIGAGEFVGRLASGPIGGQSPANAITMLGIEAGATADQTDSEIESAYNNRVGVIAQLEAETGSATTVRRMHAQALAWAVAPAIAALVAKLNSSADNEGAEMIRVRDVAGNFTADNVETAFEEVANMISGLVNASAAVDVIAATVALNDKALFFDTSAADVPRFQAFDAALPGLTLLATALTAPVAGDFLMAATAGGLFRKLDLALLEPAVATVTVSTAAVPLLAAHDRKRVVLTHATPILTINPNGTTAMPAGFRCEVVSHNNFQVVGGSGVSTNGVTAETYNADGRPNVLGLDRDASDSWTIVGGLEVAP